MREATCLAGQPSRILRFQSPPPMREATPMVEGTRPKSTFQSPPPMREATSVSPPVINILSPFQSPPPMREATYGDFDFSRWNKDFNPRLPCGRRHVQLNTLEICQDFNPRLPCGRRQVTDEEGNASLVFQSPPPMREATSLWRLRLSAF